MLFPPWRRRLPIDAHAKGLFVAMERVHMSSSNFDCGIPFAVSKSSAHSCSETPMQRKAVTKMKMMMMSIRALIYFSEVLRKKLSFAAIEMRIPAAWFSRTSLLIQLQWLPVLLRALVTEYWKEGINAFSRIASYEYPTWFQRRDRSKFMALFRRIWFPIKDISEFKISYKNALLLPAKVKMISNLRSFMLSESNYRWCGGMAVKQCLL